MRSRRISAKKWLLLLAVPILLSMLALGNARADEFGVLSESHLYPDGLVLNTDSRLEWWSNISTSADYADKREGKSSLKGTVQADWIWFGCGVMYDQDGAPWSAQPKNMSAYSNGSLKFWVKTETDLKVGIKDENGVEKWVLLQDFGIAKDNQWRFASIPISGNFSGVDFSKVTYLFMTASVFPWTITANSTFHFDNVRWDTAATGSMNSIDVTPSAYTIASGLPKAFKAQGYDASGNTVGTYPSWTSSGVSGSFINTTGAITIFTPSALSGSGTLTATDNALFDNASILVEQITWNDYFNLYGEEGLYGSIGIYDSDDNDGDEDGIENNSITLDTVTNEHPPGETESLKATYSIIQKGWAGAFIQEGAFADTAANRDVGAYEDGYLHFWVKTPVDLEINLRSLNIAGNNVASGILLSEYNIAADNSWHEVYIALMDFKLRDARLDFTQMKVYFNTAVVGDILGGASSGIFYLSDVRYVRYNPGPEAFTVAIKRRDNNNTEGEVGWPSMQLGDGWTLAEHYLEITYDPVETAWAVQLYTDNMRTGASPKYPGSPTTILAQQPAGLVGELNSSVACPMAWMALDEVNADVPVPIETDNGQSPNHPDYKIYFDSSWGAADPKGEWSWMKDLSSTKWDDKNGNLSLDLTGSFGGPDYEIVSDFAEAGNQNVGTDDYSTLLDMNGVSTGWIDISTGMKVYDLNAGSPVRLYLAAKFQTARERQKYRTNSLTMELYHE